MKILSPFKDFYDYVVIESDNRKVYERETKEVVYTELEHKKSPERTILSLYSWDKMRREIPKQVEPIDKGYLSVICFCNRMRMYLVYDGVLYWHYEDIPEEVIKILQKSVKSRWSSYEDESYIKYSWFRSSLKDMLRFKKLDWVKNIKTDEIIETKLNEIFNCPVLMINNASMRNIVLNPKLSEIGFNKVITPTEAYQDIYNWIPYHEPQPNNSPTDMSRYEAKGFDKKTSFRPNMK